MMWAIMSVAPAAVCAAGSVNVRLGLRMEKRGRRARGVRRLIFFCRAALVMTLLPEPSLPAAGMVSTVPTGRASLTVALCS